MRTLLLAGLLGLSSAAWAWHDTGHRVVGLIAAREMQTDPAKVYNLLNYLPSRDTGARSFIYPELNGLLAAESTDTRVTPARLDDASVWADKVRRSWMDRPAWHYVNYPVLGPGGVAPRNRAGLAEQAMVAMIGAARNPNLSPSTRATALAWVCHLVGDIHMPLHATAYFSRLHPKGDKGGNEFFIWKNPATGQVEPNKKWNLHTFWDQMGKSEQLGVSVLLDRVLGLEFPTPRYETLDQISTNVKSWALESLTIAKQDAYKGLSPWQTTVSPAYQRRCQEISLIRVNQAGRRLAAVIDWIFRE